MWRRPLVAFNHLTRRRFFSSSSSSATDVPVLYSFLQPTIFPLRRWQQQQQQSPQTQPPPSTSPSLPVSSPPPGQALGAANQEALEYKLRASLHDNDTDEAWRSFKALASATLPTDGSLANALISHLASLRDLHNLKRAFAAAVFLLEKSPRSLEAKTLGELFLAMDVADAAAPAAALVRAMFKNRFFAPFDVWGPILIRIAGRGDSFDKFVRIFEENCRISLEERIESMKPDLGACNAVLDGCCRQLGSVVDAEKVLEIMSALGVSQDVRSFGSLAYLYASKGFQSRIAELEKLMCGLGIMDKNVLYENLVGGYVKSCDFDSIQSVILRALREEQEGSDGRGSVFGEETYVNVAKCFIESGKIKELAGLIIESQQFESTQASTGVGNTVGYRIMDACLILGMLEKAHSILDEMNARGAPVGLGVYSSILKAYCKERKTAEAALLVTEISAAGLQLDASSYDALIDASMSAQDFQSAFSLFRDMREARLPDLKASYLTIMTGLMENHRPELMAGFLDSVVEDPRVEVATHDWNSIIHAFCKAGRLEDARRTYRRMTFLQFEPNEQTYISLINGYVSAEKYFSVLILWTEVRRKGIKMDHSLVDAFLYALVKGGFFDAAMQVVEKAQELKIFVDKWRHKQAFMETHKKLKVAKLRRRNFRKMEAVVAFKNWAGLGG